MPLDMNRVKVILADPKNPSGTRKEIEFQARDNQLAEFGKNVLSVSHKMPVVGYKCSNK